MNWWSYQKKAASQQFITMSNIVFWFCVTFFKIITQNAEIVEWYHIALVLRDATNAVKPGKFKMWLNGDWKQYWQGCWEKAA